MAVALEHVPVVDVAGAAAALESAQAAERAALVTMRDAESELEGARRAFSLSPSAELEEALEAAERAQRRAQRFAEARTEARGAAEQAHAAAVGAAARERLVEIEQGRAGVLADVAVAFSDAEQLYERIAAVVGRLHAAVARDAELVRSARQAAAEGEVRFMGEPLALPVVRMALGQRLSEQWELPDELPVVSPPLAEFFRLVGALGEPGGTVAATRARLHALNEVWGALVGTGVAGWLELAPAPAWSAGGSGPQRYAEAQKLLQLLDDTDDERNEDHAQST